MKAEQIGERIRFLREEIMRVSPETIAPDAGITGSFWRRIDKGRDTPSLPALLAIVEKGLKMTMGDFFSPG